MRYDGGGLDVSGGALHVELSGGDIEGRGNTDPANLVLQRAPAGAWTIETTVRVPLRSGSQQAGLLVYRDDGDYVTLVAARQPAARVRFRLVGEAGTLSRGTLRRRPRRARETKRTGSAWPGRGRATRVTGA